MKRIVILGATGSIGTNALDVIKRNPNKFKVVGLAAKENYVRLAHQARRFNVHEIAIYNEKYYQDLRSRVSAKTKVYAGLDGISKIAQGKNVDLVLVAIGGTISIVPLIKAIKAGKQIALASKEALVSAGAVVQKCARENRVKIIPVDSEHSAIFQCLGDQGTKFLKQIYLTGTGGPLRTLRKSIFNKLPISRVINHPKWKMGRKITVDSATLMNKGLEIIEAKWLFSVETNKIKVLLHPEAIIHSMVEFVDGIVMANMFYPDMKFPIAYAFSYPERLYGSRLPQLDFCSLKKLTFETPNMRKFPALNLAYHASKSESACAVLNAANEEAVAAYLDRKIEFTKIIDTIEKVLRLHRRIEKPTLKEILNLDKWAKEEVKRLC